ncbi:MULTISPECIES: DUF916 and DUF3324 domain-containing protein [Brochothrix]|uniref:Uncharacterized protein n=1 Tax=Brochothrix thermosphacta TaxID=2756 RepID=A0A291BYK2_BROTH|nr:MULTISPECIES: DUF916 and DUF3324 domain-containing protein [Brochothrix]ATF26298.1 hypothetical protein CNY62_07865 [Brochothrix thermosphacta]ATH85639.1 hypothetical protein CPF12_07460 [Brochothrix thermosphacta]MBR5525640.1 DUF916 and DUF3324 domain-containing protein [Brochothrix sp.]MPQ28680.1 DUF916 and DUF3324 domain-containing protein [Brochothrix thermosphacta]WKK69284.1 DUF916 and DUF3324 domain-containing protein [Brochothrix thermosphacta]
MKKRQGTIFLITFIFFLSLMPTTFSKASELNFSVNAVIPDNQIDKEKSYFDLKVTPGEKQKLKVKLRNTTDKEIVINPHIQSAKTNKNGVIDYTPNKIKKDDTLKIAMEDVAKVPEEVTVPPQSEKDLTIEVTVPKDKFDGVILGGIYLKEDTSKNKEEDKENDVAIKNEYSYVVALQMRQNDNKVKPMLHMNEVNPETQNARNVIVANIQNSEPMIISKLKIDATVNKKGSKDNLAILKKENLQVAPNSNFNIAVPLEGEKLEAGTYILNMKAESAGKEWQFKKEFSISADKATTMNEKDVTLEKETPTMLYIFLGVAFLIVIAVVIYFIIRRNKRK